MTTCNIDPNELPLLPNREASMSGLQTEVSHRLVIDEEDIVGTMSRDYILVDLAEVADAAEVADVADVAGVDDVALGARPTIYDEVEVVADNFAGNFALTYEQPADDAARDADVTTRARQIEEDDDSIRELATTGDGV